MTGNITHLLHKDQEDCSFVGGSNGVGRQLPGLVPPGLAGVGWTQRDELNAVSRGYESTETAAVDGHRSVLRPADSCLARISAMPARTSADSVR